MRAQDPPKIVTAAVIDPVHDVLLMPGGLSASGVWDQSIAAVSLADGSMQVLVTTGDSSVTLGPSSSAVWDAANGRDIVLGGGLFQPNDVNPAQVYALDLVDGAARLTRLPDFPEGPTDDVPLPVIYDPVGARVVVVAETPDLMGEVHTYALDTTPGNEGWSLLSSAQTGLSFTFYASAAYDPVKRRMIWIGGGTSQGTPNRAFALSLDAPSAWIEIPGTLPPLLDRNLFPLFWDPGSCSFLAAVASPEQGCAYALWDVSVDSALSATSRGMVTQPMPRAARTASGLDATRGRVIFGSGFDCSETGVSPATSIDLVSLVR